MDKVVTRDISILRKSESKLPARNIPTIAHETVKLFLDQSKCLAALRCILTDLGKCLFSQSIWCHGPHMWQSKWIRLSTVQITIAQHIWNKSIAGLRIQLVSLTRKRGKRMVLIRDKIVTTSSKIVGNHYSQDGKHQIT